MLLALKVMLLDAEVMLLDAEVMLLQAEVMLLQGERDAQEKHLRLLASAFSFIHFRHYLVSKYPKPLMAVSIRST